jgi:hypothetical protein
MDQYIAQLLNWIAGLRPRAAANQLFHHGSDVGFARTFDEPGGLDPCRWQTGASGGFA